MKSRIIFFLGKCCNSSVFFLPLDSFYNEDKISKIKQYYTNVAVMWRSFFIILHYLVSNFFFFLCVSFENSYKILFILCLHFFVCLPSLLVSDKSSAKIMEPDINVDTTASRKSILSYILWAFIS